MSGRRLAESFTQSGPLRVDREKGVIFGVRVLGHESRNTYGVAGVEATEYAESSHRDACRLYEGMKVNIDHVREGGKERSSRDKFGVLRNAKTVIESNHPATYADLHYLKSHEMADRVAEDVEKGMGVFGLSHDAFVGKERVDRGRKRLVIESLRKVNSVDLVGDAATNRNLWESEEPTMKTTLRAVLEGLKSLPPNKAKWVRRLVEDGDMGMPMAADVSAAADAEPDDMLAAGFRAAILAIVDDEGMDAGEKVKRIGKLIRTHEKLKGDGDAADAPESNPDEGKKMESVDPAEHAALKAKLAAIETDAKLAGDVRRLCESVKFAPTEVQTAALKALPDDTARKQLIESFRPAVEPRSGYSGKPVTDGTYTAAADTKSFLQRIRG